MTQANQAAHNGNIEDAVALIDAAFTDFTEHPDDANEALATVPLRELVIVGTLALESVKMLAPELYRQLVEKHKLVPQDSQA